MANLFVLCSLIEQLICRQWGNLNEIAYQTGRSGHSKSNSRIEAAPKCRPAHPKERGVVLGNQKQADANKAAAAPRDADLRPILETMRDRRRKHRAAIDNHRPPLMCC
jgi:hypothetical protein